MFAAWVSSSVRLPEYVRSTPFRWTLVVSGVFALCILLLFGFIYWQTAAYLKARVDTVMTQDMAALAADAPDKRLAALSARLAQDPRRIRLAGLFSADGQRLSGNVEGLPPALDPDTGVHSVVVMRVDTLGREQQAARAIARTLPNGEVLMIGRNVDELVELTRIVEETLALGLLPALCLAVATGML